MIYKNKLEEDAVCVENGVNKNDLEKLAPVQRTNQEIRPGIVKEN